MEHPLFLQETALNEDFQELNSEDDECMEDDECIEDDTGSVDLQPGVTGPSTEQQSNHTIQSWEHCLLYAKVETQDQNIIPCVGEFSSLFLVDPNIPIDLVDHMILYYNKLEQEWDVYTVGISNNHAEGNIDIFSSSTGAKICGVKLLFSEYGYDKQTFVLKVGKNI